MKCATRIVVPANQVKRAKVMRANMTEAERKLWRGLRYSIVLEETHFRRHMAIAGYVTDFCCHAAKLVVEVDGNQHGTDEALGCDARRSVAIEAHGYRVLRFANHDVLSNLDSVLDTIAASIQSQEPSHG